MVAVRDAFRKPDSSMLDRRLVVDKYFEDKRTKLNSLQAVELLKILAMSCGDNLERLETLSKERIHFVVSVHRGLRDWEQASALLEKLNAEERVEAELQLGYPPYIFTPLNPTGRHRLRLNKVITISSQRSTIIRDPHCRLPSLGSGLCLIQHCSDVSCPLSLPSPGARA